MREIRTVAVLSDMHFTSSTEARDIKQTHAVLTDQPIKNQYPPADLLELIKEQDLKADAVVCAGDITVGADQPGLVAAWAFINDVAKALGAATTLATTGNHDIASRDLKTTPEVWESLRRLSPRYPYPQGNEIDELTYWGNHFLIVETEWARFVTLNTCNSHARGEVEYAHGRITDFIIEQLYEKLQRSTQRHAINILLCHHHPAKHPAIRQDYEDYSEMAHGAKLLEQLQKDGSGWLVIHGHRHSPRLHYAQGPSSGPAILSAGSLSAKLESTYFPKTTNQFYLVDFDVSESNRIGQAATIRAWDWIKSNGWVPAPYDENRTDRIVSGSGFGMRVAARLMAGRIVDSFAADAPIPWTEVKDLFPELRFVTPDDTLAILRELRQHFGYDTIDGNPINPTELVK